MREAIKKLSEFVLGERELSKIGTNFLSLCFLIVAVGISFQEFTDPNASWFFLKNSALTFKPDFISTIVGLGLLTPLYGRRLVKWNKSIYSILYFILASALFASTVELAFFGGNQSNVTVGLIGISLVLSWFGLREIAGFAWIFCFIATIYNVLINNIALGFYGYIYVISGFLGILLSTNLTPAELIQALKEEYSAMGRTSIVEKTKEDVQAAQDLVDNTLGKAMDMVKNK
nr:hypothetical protein [uncultured Haemophilus sp.]